MAYPSRLHHRNQCVNFGGPHILTMTLVLATSHHAQAATGAFAAVVCEEELALGGLSRAGIASYTLVCSTLI